VKTLVRIECRVPLRIDLAGGWSDIPPFARREGGAVLNAAITQYVTGDVWRSPEPGQENLRISYGLDLPAGAGLGSSAALSVAWLALVHANMGHALDRRALAQKACDLGALLGILGGKQDEYASALGGVNLMRFGEGVQVEPLDLAPEVREGLQAHLVLCYSGRARLSGDIHDRVWAAYEQGDATVCACLAELRDVALAMREALVRGDFARTAGLMSRNWAAQKRLHASITNADVERLFAAALGAGALAGKACGAGGGGCLVFLADPPRVYAVRTALHNAGAQIIDARIDWDGVVLSSA
jgi:D-glycero-alpha-D-manno-heptose-7-phosphate kinase